MSFRRPHLLGLARLDVDVRHPEERVVAPRRTVGVALALFLAKEVRGLTV